MPNDDFDPISIERAVEQLRQEREVFEQRKRQESQWFVLRLVLGYSSVALLAVVILIAWYILANSSRFSATVQASAGGALFVDVLGLVITVWKTLLSPDSVTRLEPVTRAEDLGSGTSRNDL